MLNRRSRVILAGMWRLFPSLFSRTASAPPPKEDGLQLAQAALLIHAARIDGTLAAEEEKIIRQFFAGAFGLDQAQVADLYARALAEEERRHDLYRWTSRINRDLPLAARVGFMEKLWQLAGADKMLDDYEAQLLRRLAGLLHVPDRLSAAARQRAMKTL